MVILAVIWVLNLVDACATWLWVGKLHVGYEVNPIMCAAIAHGWVAFFVAKLLLGTAGVIALAHGRHRLALRVGKWIVFSIYAALCAWHGVVAVLVLRG